MSGRARLTTHRSEGPNLLRVCAEEIRVIRAAGGPRVPLPVPVPVPVPESPD